jgi:hypothetical protein
MVVKMKKTAFFWLVLLPASPFRAGCEDQPCGQVFDPPLDPPYFIFSSFSRLDLAAARFGSSSNAFL